MMPFNSAWALTTVRDWSITNVTRQGDTTTLSGSKSVIVDGNVINKTSTAKVASTTSMIVKNIVKTGAAVAVVTAITELIGAGVQYVLDSAAQVVKYTDTSVRYDDPSQQYYYSAVYDPLTRSTTLNGAISKAASEFCIRNNFTGCTAVVVQQDSPTQWKIEFCNGNRTYCLFNYAVKIANPNYNPTAPKPDEKTLSYEAVAQKIKSKAQSNDPDAVAYAGQAVDEAISNDPQVQDDVANQFNSNSKTQTNEQATGDTTPKNPSDPAAGDTIKLNFPVFCTWAPLVCEAAQTAINFPKTITEWYTSTKTAFTEAYDFAKTKVQEFSDIFKDEQQTDTELEFNEPTDDITDTSVSFASSCPPPIVLADFNFHGIPIHWELDFTAWCDSLSTYLKPIVISMASFSAVLILGGVRENG